MAASHHNQTVCEVEGSKETYSSSDMTAETEMEVAQSSVTLADTPVSASADKDTQQSEELCEFFLKGKCRFGEECRNKHPEGIETKYSPKTKKKDKQKKKEQPEDLIVAKKPPMKTAGDVRDRIMWDSALPAEYFTLGYVDRFAGLVERPYTSFVWGDLCDAGPDDLAIPQHCMAYFKYKGTKVWDKETRLDHVFGSAGNVMKINEKMAQIDEELRVKAAERHNDPDYDSDDDSDDEFGVVLAGNSGVLGVGEDIRDEIQKQDAPRASHFLCVRVTDPAVVQQAKIVQEAVYMQDPSLRSSAMPEELMHVTLTMLKCDSTEATQKVNDLLNSIKPELQELVRSTGGQTVENGDLEPQRMISANGLTTFGSRVLYVKLKVPESFIKIRDLIQEKIRTMEDVSVTNNFEFVPHMTLIKINRSTEKERRSKYMNSSLYDSHLDDHFGIIKFDNINFCLIDDNRGSDGFYQTVMTMQF